jgi:hypothetical protein
MQKVCRLAMGCRNGTSELPPIHDWESCLHLVPHDARASCCVPGGCGWVESLSESINLNVMEKRNTCVEVEPNTP